VRAAFRAASLVASAVALAGCSQFATDGLQLRADDSIEIEVPADRSQVVAPITVRWADVAPRQGGGYAVLIDRSPMPPGEDVAWFSRDDESCIEAQGCPDATWLARHGITITAVAEATIEIVPRRSASDDRGPHELTVIRLDADGRRDGEAAFSVHFDLEDDR
jgi:hypothetical protein